MKNLFIILALFPTLAFGSLDEDTSRLSVYVKKSAESTEQCKTLIELAGGYEEAKKYVQIYTGSAKGHDVKLACSKINMHMDKFYTLSKKMHEEYGSEKFNGAMEKVYKDENSLQKLQTFMEYIGAETIAGGMVKLMHLSD